MILAINYADYKYRKTQKFNSETAIHKGKVDKVISYSPKDMDRIFFEKNKKILEQSRGNGYWLWKPYFIQRALEELNENDYLIYLDSGAFYINDVKFLLDQMKKDNQYIMAFEVPFKERWYTKRDVFLYMGCDSAQYTETNQRMATMILINKTETAVRFVNEWLYLCQQEDIITDEKNHLGKHNYRGFIDNRHDQSVFSVLSKKYGIKAYRDPSQYGRFPDVFWRQKTNLSKCRGDYPQIIAKHTNTEVLKRIIVEQQIFAYAPKMFVKLYVQSGFYRIKRKQGIAFLTDNVPIKESAYGFGMYKVVHRLVEALNQDLSTIIITDRNYTARNVDSAFSNKIIVKNKFHNLKGEWIADIFFLLEILKTVYMLRKRGITKIFIPLGADLGELKRAYLVSKYFRLEVSVYVVDDFIEYQSKILGVKIMERLEKQVKRYLRAMSHIFVISEGMQDRIFEIAKRESVVLPIPYEYKEINLEDRQNNHQIMFLGSINDLYIKGIKDIAEIIDKINIEKGLHIELLFTYQKTVEVKRIIGNYKCIRSRRIEQENELRETMRNCMFCFLPYSDDPVFFLMQNTSFPSKLIEYMSAAKSIVIYGNRQNTAATYFEKHGANQVIYGSDRQELEECILNHVKEVTDYSGTYINMLMKRHSFRYIREKITRHI